MPNFTGPIYKNGQLLGTIASASPTASGNAWSVTLESGQKITVFDSELTGNSIYDWATSSPQYNYLYNLYHNVPLVTIGSPGQYIDPSGTLPPAASPPAPTPSPGPGTTPGTGPAPTPTPAPGTGPGPSPTPAPFPVSLLDEDQNLAYLTHLSGLGLRQGQGRFLRNQFPQVQDIYNTQLGQQIAAGNVPSTSFSQEFLPNFNFLQYMNKFSPQDKGMGVSQFTPRTRFLF